MVAELFFYFNFGSLKIKECRCTVVSRCSTLLPRTVLYLCCGRQRCCCSGFKKATAARVVYTIREFGRAVGHSERLASSHIFPSARLFPRQISLLRCAYLARRKKKKRREVGTGLNLWQSWSRSAGKMWLLCIHQAATEVFQQRKPLGIWRLILTTDFIYCAHVCSGKSLILITFVENVRGNPPE